ncbi:nitroreductase family protein [Labrenzia aggregata]|uniref:Nitroreductase family protein n=2 Tax=Roseibium aggregatum TaxID=187304 RepID=A0A939IZ14_9HYPH|nr:nitroreductase family protein [Roseibium aggregatum]
MLMTDRKPDHPIETLFVDRWSPRAFDGSQMPEADLMTVLEAARWAPSAFNIQPWRFVHARRSDRDWQKLVDLLNPFNRDWAQHASALVYLFSDTEVDGRDGKPNRPSGTHSFDAGSAWAHAALQATALGYHAHAMAGILMEEISEQLGVPERFKPEIAIAIGRLGDGSQLSEDLREREIPSHRKSLGEIAFAGTWS